MHSIEERSGIDSDRLHLVCFYCLSRSADPADFVAACTGYYEGTKVRRYEGIIIIYIIYNIIIPS